MYLYRHHLVFTHAIAVAIDTIRETESGSSRSSNNDIQVDQLEACGYEVIPDVFEDDGGTWGLINKVQTRGLLRTLC